MMPLSWSLRPNTLKQASTEMYCKMLDDGLSIFDKKTRKRVSGLVVPNNHHFTDNVDDIEDMDEDTEHYHLADIKIFESTHSQSGIDFVCELLTECTKITSISLLRHITNFC